MSNTKADGKLDIDQIKRKYELASIEVFYNLLKLKDGQTISADDVVSCMVARQIAPQYISKQVGALMKSAKSNGLLLKTNQFILSSRSSKPLPCYICRHKGA